MSDEDSPRPVDRPKLAEALASLKQGLADSADPFFDGWKRPRAQAQALDNAAKVAELRPVATDTIEQAAMVDSLPTEIGGVGLSDGASVGAQVPPHDEQHAPTIDVEKVRLTLSPEETSAVARSPEQPASIAPRAADAPASTVFTPKRGAAQASLRDTVRVRIVRYPVFPRWSLVLAAALMVFAASLLALRAGYHPDPPALVLATPGVPVVAVSTHQALAAPSLAEPVVPPTAEVVVAGPTAEALVAAPTAAAVVAPQPSAVPDRGRTPPAPELRNNNKSRDTKPRATDLFREPGF